MVNSKQSYYKVQQEFQGMLLKRPPGGQGWPSNVYCGTMLFYHRRVTNYGSWTELIFLFGEFNEKQSTAKLTDIHRPKRNIRFSVDFVLPCSISTADGNKQSCHKKKDY